MENLEVGKQYVCEKYHLLLYPDNYTATRLCYDQVIVADEAAGGRRSAAYWSKQLGKPVSYVDKNTIILVLNSKKTLHEVLAGDRKGWIIYHDSLNIKEIV